MKTDNPIELIIRETEHTGPVSGGMFKVQKVNDMIDATLTKKDPEDLFFRMWFEGEIVCLFGNSNCGKSIFAVQIADRISRSKKVLYVDCELSDKQFQIRYTRRDTDPDTGEERISVYRFSENFLRATIDPDKLTEETYGTNVITQIEHTAIHNEVQVIFIDNITFLCSTTEKGDDAGLFMMKLMSLKKKHGWSLLIIAHTPKRNMSNPITQNDLAGSKKLYNFFDSVFAIGKSAKDNRLRYVKQIKVRAGEYRYDSDNVIVYEIDPGDGFLHFEHIAFSSESEHLKSKDEDEDNTEMQNILELKNQGKSIRDIACIMGMSKSAVGRAMKKAEAKAAAQAQTNQSTTASKDRKGKKAEEQKSDNDTTLFKKEEK